MAAKPKVDPICSLCEQRLGNGRKHQEKATVTDRINCAADDCEDPDNPGKPRVMFKVCHLANGHRWLKCKAGHRQYV